MSTSRNEMLWQGLLAGFTFLVVGMLSAWLAALSEKAPLLWYAGGVLFLVMVLHLIAAVVSWKDEEAGRAARR